MSESDYYAGEFTNREIDSVANAGDFYLDESGFFLMPTQEEMRKLTGCLILDVCMPGMSGLELKRKIAAADRHMPIIFITAHQDDDRRARALETGAVAFLYKPFYEEELLNAIDSALRGS
jgi:FixJ family two-component response regulator